MALVGALALGLLRPYLRSSTAHVDPSAAPPPGPFGTPSVAPPGAPVATSVAPGAALPSPWDSPQACRDALARTAPPRSDVLRLGTWNVRWFPDGGPGERATDDGRGPLHTNVEWLGCTLGVLRLDVIALQEIKGTPRARAALEELTMILAQRSGQQWSVELDTCPGKGRQHVAIVYDTARLNARERRDVASLNPSGTGACDRMLRPGLAMYFERPGGADFHFIVAHSKSGGERRDMELRQRTIEGLEAAFDDAQRRVPDQDVVVAGDLNTMGCPDCSPAVGAVAELSVLDDLLRRGARPFRRVPANAPCSHYYRGRGTLLDHFLVSTGMTEVGGTALAQVEGYCGARACTPLSGAQASMPRAYRELSDHCPVVVEVDGRDLD